MALDLYSGSSPPATDFPTNTSVVQAGLTNFTVSWTPPTPTPEGYVIFFQGGDDEDSVTVEDGSTTTVNIDGRVNGRQYSVTMVALSQHLPSTVTSPEMVMLCKYSVGRILLCVIY